MKAPPNLKDLLRPHAKAIFEAGRAFERRQPRTFSAAPTAPADTPLDGIHWVPLSSLKLRPDELQFRRGAGDDGTARPLPEEKFSPAKCKALLVWRDPADGSDNVVDGHHRYNWAERDGQPILPVRWSKAATAAEAKAEGERLNRAQGTAFSAAKTFSAAFTADDAADFSKYYAASDEGFPGTLHHHFACTVKDFAGKTGLVRKQITDKNGKKTWHWVRTGDDKPAPPNEAPANEKPSATPPAPESEHVQHLLARVNEVPPTTLGKVTNWVKAKHKALSERYGENAANIILASTVLLLPVPFPGTSLVPMAMAEAVKRLRHFIGFADDGPDHLDVQAIAREVVAELYQEMGETPPPDVAQHSEEMDEEQFAEFAGGLVAKTITVKKSDGTTYKRRVMVRPEQAKAPERHPSKVAPGVDYGNPDDRDSDDKHFKKQIATASKNVATVRAALDAAIAKHEASKAEVAKLKQQMDALAKEQEAAKAPASPSPPPAPAPKPDSKAPIDRGHEWAAKQADAHAEKVAAHFGIDAKSARFVLHNMIRRAVEQAAKNGTGEVRVKTPEGKVLVVKVRRKKQMAEESDDFDLDVETADSGDGEDIAKYMVDTAGNSPDDNASGGTPDPKA